MKKIRTIHAVYRQILIVCLMFAVMVVSSYFLVSNIMRSHLHNEAKAALDLMQAAIEADLLEPEMLLHSISQSLRNFILRGYSPQMVSEYIKDIYSMVTKDGNRKLSISGLYGNFDAFGGLQINGGNWETTADYVPQERPWYKAAVRARIGETAFTEPYIDVRTSGLVVSCACRIFDEDLPLGVIGLDIPLEKIMEYAVNTKIAEGGFGMLLNQRLEVIAHPDPRWVGKPFRSINADTSLLANDLVRGKDTSERTIINSMGTKSVVFFRQLKTGWYVGLITPTTIYYRQVKNMGLALAAIGLVLAGLLSVILWRIAVAKIKSDAENRQKSEFLATMSHEIRTPLNAILGITEIQLQNRAVQEDTKEALRKIYNSGDLLLGIINDILDFSKIEAGKMELVPVKYYVSSMINDVVQLNKVKYESKAIVFKLNVGENVPSVLLGDELRIKQILNNLLSNAFKYTDKGEISLSVSAEHAVRTSSYVMLVFVVSDTGQGMTKEQVRKLYDEYSRFNREANRTTQGTGLGMSITQKLVQIMEGAIEVKSDPGKGTAVTVRLPQRNVDLATSGMIGKEMAETLQQFGVSSASQIEKMQLVYDPMPYGKVLVVDDVDTNLYVAKGLLAPYELSIDTVTSGSEAINKISGGNVYDIIFMDHMMPVMDGIEAAKIIRDMGYTHPIIALTANALVGQAEMFMKNGFDGFISKPIDVRQLNAALNKLVRDKQPYEVIEAARREKQTRQASPPPPVVPPPQESFVRDAERALAILGTICKNGFYRINDLKIFTITVHAIKKALEDVGETDLSAAAAILEQAGQSQDIALMLAETPAFLQALRAASKKFRAKGDGSEPAGEDQAFLHEKLLAVEAACAMRDKKAAKDTLVELKHKTWSHPTKDMLNTVVEYVLQGNFEEAEGLMRDYDNA